MFIRSQTIRKPNGKRYTYYRLVESFRQHGQVRQRVLGELGALSAQEAARLAQRLAQIAGLPWEGHEPVEELSLNGMLYFGVPLLVERLLELLRLEHWIGSALKGRKFKFDLLAVLRVMLCAHLFKSGSRAEWAVYEWQQKLFGHGQRFPDLRYIHFLRALSILKQVKNPVEEQLFFHLAGLFDLQVDLVFYDLTSTYVEGQAQWSEILKRGYSRDKRKDCKQIVIGLVLTREGLPITHCIFEGNTLDLKTLQGRVEELKRRFSVRRCIWVSDAGLLTKANRALLEGSGYEYILGAGGGSGKEIEKALEGTCGQAVPRRVGEVGLWEVALDGGRRAVVIESAGRKEKNSAILERRLQCVREGFQRLAAQAPKGQGLSAQEIRIRAEKILHQSRVRKYFSYSAEDGKFQWQEDQASVAQRKQEGGKYALITNTTLPVEEVLQAYRTLLQVEDAFRILKDELDLRPVWHQHDDNVEGHVLLAVFSLLLYKTLELQLERQGVNLTVYRALQAVKELRAVEVAYREKPLWRMLKPLPDACRVFKALGISNLKEVFNQWAQRAGPYRFEVRCTPENAKIEFEQANWEELRV